LSESNFTYASHRCCDRRHWCVLIVYAYMYFWSKSRQLDCLFWVEWVKLLNELHFSEYSYNISWFQDTYSCLYLSTSAQVRFQSLCTLIWSCISSQWWKWWQISVFNLFMTLIYLLVCRHISKKNFDFVCLMHSWSQNI